MIQEIKIKNFRSFKDEVTFSFEASNDKFAEDSQVVQINESTRLLRFAVIYGYNASGKTNLLDALDFLRYFWSYKPESLDEGTKVNPFKLDNTSSSEPTRFEVVFYVGDTKYWYQLELDMLQVHKEKLSYYKSTQPIMLFERTLENNQSVVEFNNNGNGDKISAAAKELINVNCLKNLSVFVARNQVNVSLPLIDAAKDWMKSQIMPTIYPGTNLNYYAQRKTAENKHIIKSIVDFLHEADFNVTNIQSDVIDKHIADDMIEYFMEDANTPKEEKERIKREKTIKQFQTIFEHTVETENGKETFPMYGMDESAGTLRTFGIETALIEVFNTQSLLPVDEVDTSLHPKLLEKILYDYLRIPSRTQLLVTTHNDGLLDLVDDLIRKDSIWFTEKKKSGVTDLYKLTDFRGVNRLSSIREAYRNKRFGATMN
ncbi:MAG: AAA family ATPase [Bacteroidaceae bacterium]|nr:AAA family ATPase [Bacteroidaceae bacterium]